MTWDQKIARIDTDAWYRIADVVRNKWVVNTHGTADRRHIYRLINTADLMARDRASRGAKQPLYVIRGRELIRFIQRTYL